MGVWAVLREWVWKGLAVFCIWGLGFPSHDSPHPFWCRRAHVNPDSPAEPMNGEASGRRGIPSAKERALQPRELVPPLIVQVKAGPLSRGLFHRVMGNLRPPNEARTTITRFWKIHREYL